MKRDMDLVREILIWAEKQDHGFIKCNPDIPGYSEEQIAYHVYLMHQAGLVNAFDVTVLGSKSPSWQISSLTWLGHDFLSAAQDDSIWTKAKNTVLRNAAGCAFDVLFAWLKSEVQKRIGLS